MGATGATPSQGYYRCAHRLRQHWVTRHQCRVPTLAGLSLLARMATLLSMGARSPHSVPMPMRTAAPYRPEDGHGTRGSVNATKSVFQNSLPNSVARSVVTQQWHYQDAHSSTVAGLYLRHWRRQHDGNEVHLSCSSNATGGAINSHNGQHFLHAQRMHPEV